MVDSTGMLQLLSTLLLDDIHVKVLEILFLSRDFLPRYRAHKPKAIQAAVVLVSRNRGFVHPSGLHLSDGRR